MIVSSSFWVTANILIALAFSLVAVYMLRTYFEDMTPQERAAIGMTAAGQLMRCGPIFSRNILGENSPFDDWSTLLVGVGLVVAAFCVIRRIEAHLRVSA